MRPTKLKCSALILSATLMAATPALAQSQQPAPTPQPLISAPAAGRGGPEAGLLGALAVVGLFALIIHAGKE